MDRLAGLGTVVLGLETQLLKQFQRLSWQWKRKEVNLATINNNNVQKYIDEGLIDPYSVKIDLNTTKTANDNVHRWITLADAIKGGYKFNFDYDIKNSEKATEQIQEHPTILPEVTVVGQAPKKKPESDTDRPAFSPHERRGIDKWIGANYSPRFNRASARLGMNPLNWPKHIDPSYWDSETHRNVVEGSNIAAGVVTAPFAAVAAAETAPTWAPWLSQKAMPFVAKHFIAPTAAGMAWDEAQRAVTGTTTTEQVSNYLQGKGWNPTAAEFVGGLTNPGYWINFGGTGQYTRPLFNKVGLGLSRPSAYSALTPELNARLFPRKTFRERVTNAVNTTRSGIQTLNNNIQQGKNLVRNFKISRAISKAPFAPDYQTYLDIPALQNVGSFQQYRNYLTTIFPESKYPEIAFHGGPKGIKRFRTPTKEKLNKSINTGTKDFGIYFANSEDLSKYYANKSGQVYRVKLNLPSVIRYDNPAFSQRFIGTDKLRFSPDAISKYWYDRLNLDKYNGIIQNKSGSPFSRGQITVFNPDDIHILGSSEDILKFQQWKKNPITLETPFYDPWAIPNMPAQYNINLRTGLSYIGGHTPIILGVTIPTAGIGYLWQQDRKQKIASKNKKD